MSENVIQFPKRNPRAQQNEDRITSELEIEERFNEAYETYIEEVSTHLTRSIIHKAGSFGYIFDGEKSMKDIVMIHETVKSAMLRVHDIHHPMQDAADDCEIRLEEIDEDGDIIDSHSVSWNGMTDEKDEDPVD